MFKPKGGRGHQTPYKSTHCRVPLPLKTQVSQLVDRYLEFVAETGNADEPPPLLDSVLANKAVNNFEELGQLKNQVEWLKSDRVALDQEINELHAKNGSLDLELQEIKLQLADANKLVNELQASKPVNELEIERSLEQLTFKPVNGINNLDWKVGDKCTVVMMPTGTVCEGAVIGFIERDRTNCKVNFPKTNSSFYVPLADLLPPAVVKEPVNKLDEALSVETVESAVKPVNDLKPMKAAQLGPRLGYHDHSYVLRAKSKPDFSDWSQAKDPDGIAWLYDVNSKLFYPVK